MTTLASPITSDRRRHERVQLPPMFTLARVRLAGDTQYRWTGHIHDVSRSGALLELDQNLPPGSILEIRALLPGREQVTFHARGPVVRLHISDHWQGQTRMAIRFDAFAREQDSQDLNRYLDAGVAQA